MMSRKEISVWWAYVVLGFVLFGFVAPAMISAADTMIVIGGVLFCVLFGVWTWHLWVKDLMAKLEKIIEKEWKKP